MIHVRRQLTDVAAAINNVWAHLTRREKKKKKKKSYDNSVINTAAATERTNSDYH